MNDPISLKSETPSFQLTEARQIVPQAFVRGNHKSIPIKNNGEGNKASGKISKFGIKIVWTYMQACPSSHDHPKNKKEQFFSNNITRLSNNMLQLKMDLHT